MTGEGEGVLAVRFGALKWKPHTVNGSQKYIGASLFK